MIAACTFGSEFGHGTMANYFRSLWIDDGFGPGRCSRKAHACPSYDCPAPDLRKPPRNSNLLAFSSAPALRFLRDAVLYVHHRSSIGAFVLSVAAPILIDMGAGVLILWLLKTGALEPKPGMDGSLNQEKLQHWLFGYLGASITLYCAGLYFLGYRWFQRLEVTELIERRIGLGNRLHELVEYLLGSFSPVGFVQLPSSWARNCASSKMRSRCGSYLRPFRWPQSFISTSRTRVFRRTTLTSRCSSIAR